MTKYRIIDAGNDASRRFDCDSDENAIVWAKQMVGQRPMELWRLVERLSTSDEKQAVTHEIHEGQLVSKSAK